MRKVFAEEAEVSRCHEQRRCELVDQHKNPRKPTLLMEIAVNIHPENDPRAYTI